MLQSTTHPLDNWQWRNPLPTGTELLTTAYGNGKFVAVGYGGAIYCSSDATNWSRTASGTTESLNDVVFANGVFVAVGTQGTIRRSIDGIAWSAATSGIMYNALTSVTYGNSLFVAVGGGYSNPGGQIVYSADGLNWNNANVEGYSQPFYCVTYGNGVFVAGGYDGNQSNTGSNGALYSNLMLFRSTDGLNWSRVRTDASNNTVQSLAFGNGLFVAGNGGLIRSSDGITWTASNIVTGSGGVTYGNGVFMALGGISGQSYRSVDGISWSMSIVPFQSGRGKGLSYSNGLFIFLDTHPYGQVHLSTDGLNWISNTPTDLPNLRAVAYGGGQFVAVGDQGVLRHSAGGRTWEPATSGTTAELNSLAYGNGTFVVPAGTDGAGNAKILRSVDAVNWTESSTTLNVGSWVIAFLNGEFIGVTTTGGILRSVDGAAWSQAAETSQPLTAVTFGNGVYIAVGNYGTIFSSSDGLNWVDRGSNVAYEPVYDYESDAYVDLPNLLAVQYANGMFVAVGQGGAVVTSADGMTWNFGTMMPWHPYSPNPQKLTFLEGNFVAIAPFHIWRSTNGVNWSDSLNDTGYWQGVTMGGGSVVAVGLIGAIAQNGPGIGSLSPNSATGGAPAFTLTVYGAGFTNGAIIFWDTATLPTTFVSATELTAEVSAAMLPATSDFLTRVVTVQNPDGAASFSRPFSITAANVTTIESVIAGAGVTTSVSTAPTTAGETGVSATLNNTGGDPVALTVANYSSDPSGTAFSAGGGFTDVQVTGADAADTATVNFYYPSTTGAATEVALTLVAFNGSTWFAVRSDGNTDPVKNTTNNLDGTISGGRFTVIFSATSTPKITELSGTIFAVGTPLEFTGFLAPIGGADEATGGSFANPLRTFKAGSTIPVKFTVSRDGAALLTGVHTLQAVRYSRATTPGTAIDATPQGKATTGNQFELKGSEWHFNLDTKATGLATGVWQLVATLSDGTQHRVWIQIK